MNAPLVSIMAEAGSASIDLGDPIALINTLGFPLALVIMFFTGMLVPRWAYAAQTERAEKAEANLDALNKTMRDEVVPALTQAALAVTQATDLTRALARRGD